MVHTSVNFWVSSKSSKSTLQIDKDNAKIPKLQIGSFQSLVTHGDLLTCKTDLSKQVLQLNESNNSTKNIIGNLSFYLILSFVA